MREPRSNLTQTILGVAFVALLAGLSLWIMRPFLLALIWAGAIVVATWPLLESLQRRCGGRRALAAALMTLALLLVFLLPLALAVGTIAANTDTISAGIRSVQTLALPAAPQWLADVPVVGSKLASLWDDLARTGWSALGPYVNQSIAWVVARMGRVGGALVEVVLTVVIAAILYFQGDKAARGVLMFCTRLAGGRGVRAALLATQAIRGIALGVIGTALVQSILGGIGLAITGVPLALPLTFLMFMLCVAQLGPLPVLVPVIIWLYSTGDTAWATVLVVFAAIAVTMDNVLRPYLIKKGADLPLLLIFAGVIGGLLSLGLVGIFVGPVVLAVTYRLLEEWVREGMSPGARVP